MFLKSFHAASVTLKNKDKDIMRRENYRTVSQNFVFDLRKQERGESEKVRGGSFIQRASTVLNPSLPTPLSCDFYDPTSQQFYSSQLLCIEHPIRARPRATRVNTAVSGFWELIGQCG